MKIAEVMTANVLTVRPETSLKEVARILSACGISGLPVVDDDERVVGVVSEADILAKARRPHEDTRREKLLHQRRDGAKREARTAGDAMTSPAITIAPYRGLDVGAALMLDHAVNRLPVVDDEGRLEGIVSRADLVRAFASSDARIEREIRDDVLRHELWLDSTGFDLSVREGEVELSGRLDSDEQRELVEDRLRLVPGVVSVVVRAC